jgi:hypothetical protein
MPSAAPELTPHQPPTARRTTALLVAVLFVAYLANFRYISTGDTDAVRYIPFSVLLDGRLDVDRFIAPHLEIYKRGGMPYGVYFATQSRGHWMSSYPVLTPLVATPLYIPAAVWVARRAPSPHAMMFVAEAMEKFSAALIAALSAGILYLALRRLLPSGGALALTLIYALASPTWSTSSQVLWLHALTQLSLALLIYALVRDDGSPKSALLIGLAIALAAANKPTNVVTVAPVLLWMLWKQRARVVPLLTPIVVLGGLVFAYNLYYFGNLLGAYTQALESMGYAQATSGFRGNFFEGFAGLLVSPNRGLFIFVPWTLFAAWGAARLWHTNQHGSRALVIGAVFHLLLYAKLERWYAGYCFGPRYMADILPLLTFFLVPLWPVLTASRLLKPAFALAVALSFGIQVIGAYFHPNGEWSSTPVSIDVAPQRAWDWHDLQIVRTLRAGPAPTRLLDHLRGNHAQQP